MKEQERRVQRFILYTFCVVVYVCFLACFLVELPIAARSCEDETNGSLLWTYANSFIDYEKVVPLSVSPWREAVKKMVTHDRLSKRGNARSLTVLLQLIFMF